MAEGKGKPLGPIDLSTRLALSPAEAAEALGVSENCFRASVLPDLPVTRLGRRVLIPLELIQTWLRDHAQAGESRVSQAVDELLNGAR